MSNISLPALRPVRSPQDHEYNWQEIRSFFERVAKNGGLISLQDMVNAKIVNNSLVPQVNKPVQQYVNQQIANIPVTTNNGAQLILYANDNSGRKWVFDSVNITSYTDDNGNPAEQIQPVLREI